MNSIIFIISIFFTVGGFIWLLLGKSLCKFEGLVKNCAVGFCAAFLFLALHWALISYYIRYIIVIFFIILFIWLHLKTRKYPFFIKLGIARWCISILCLIVTIFIGYHILSYCKGYLYDEEPVYLALPLKNGLYSVIWGGNGKTSPLMNYHYSGSIAAEMGLGMSSKYATDIVKLNSFGKNTIGLNPNPHQLNKHAIFNEIVYSPCDGEIVDVVDGLSDEIPAENGGNSVLIKKDEVYVYMCHFKKESIKVRIGNQIKKGDEIGRVGCSGNAGGPHLHIEARKGYSWGSEGVPILFDGKFPVENCLFFR